MQNQRQNTANSTRERGEATRERKRWREKKKAEEETHPRANEYYETSTLMMVFIITRQQRP